MLLSPVHVEGVMTSVSHVENVVPPIVGDPSGARVLTHPPAKVHLNADTAGLQIETEAVLGQVACLDHGEEDAKAGFRAHGEGKPIAGGLEVKGRVKGHLWLEGLAQKIHSQSSWTAQGKEARQR